MNMITSPAALTVHAERDALGWLQRRDGDRYSSMTELRDALKERSIGTKSETVRNKDIRLISMDRNDIQTKDDMNKLLVEVNGQTMGMSHWSFGQMASLAKAPAAFLRTLPAELVRDTLDYSLRFNRDVERVMPYHDGTNLRAVTGPAYGRVDDASVVDAIATVLDSGRWTPAEGHMGLRATDRSLQMFLIDQSNPVVVGKAPNGNDDVMYRGLRISNSELGYSSLSVEGFYFRGYCQNGMIFQMKEAHKIAIRHTKSAPFRWAREVQPAIEAYVNEDASKLVDQVFRAKQASVAHDNDQALDWLKNRGLSAAQSREAVERVQAEEGRNPRTVWDMVQGVTAMARSIGGVEERADMERLAGSFWSKVAA